MKKRFIPLIAFILVLITGTSLSASYTLPEKMSNQLAIGSGLKGTFTITASGEKYQTPFMKAVTDAEFSIRGISSGNDFHYYVFQSDEKENQSAVSELYRKDGVCYFRSDMVQGKILSVPTLSQFIDALFPSSGENGSSSSFVSKLISLPEAEKKEKWEPILIRYQNALELWLAEFTVNADTVKLDSGFSALDFTYEIPMDSIREKIISLYEEITSDPEAVSLLDSVMSESEKKIYMNGNLIYFYQEALNSLDLHQPVRMNKRVSAMGDLLRFRIILPLDERTTGYQSLDIETIEKTTFYTLKSDRKIIVFGIPDTDSMRKKDYGQSIWFACINTEAGSAEIKDNLALRIDIKKTTDTYDEEEKNHETEQYKIIIQQDTSYLPENTDLTLLPDYQPTTIDIHLHYSSKFAQNSATNLDITAEMHQGDSFVKVEGLLKTAAPWLFMPFEIIDPIDIGTRKEEVLIPYLTDWISNAASIIHHKDSVSENTLSDGSEETPADPIGETSVHISEDEKKEITDDVDIETEQDNENAETYPLDETEAP